MKWCWGEMETMSIILIFYLTGFLKSRQQKEEKEGGGGGKQTTRESKRERDKVRDQCSNIIT